MFVVADDVVHSGRVLVVDGPEFIDSVAFILDSHTQGDKRFLVVTVKTVTEVVCKVVQVSGILFRLDYFFLVVLFWRPEERRHQNIDEEQGDAPDDDVSSHNLFGFGVVVNSGVAVATVFFCFLYIVTVVADVGHQ